MTSKEYKISNKVNIEIEMEINKNIASFLLSLPVSFNYDVWWLLHTIKGDLE